MRRQDVVGPYKEEILAVISDQNVSFSEPLWTEFETDCDWLNNDKIRFEFLSEISVPKNTVAIISALQWLTLHRCGWCWLSPGYSRLNGRKLRPLEELMRDSCLVIVGASRFAQFRDAALGGAAQAFSELTPACLDALESDVWLKTVVRGRDSSHGQTLTIDDDVWFEVFDWRPFFRPDSASLVWYS